MHRAMSLRPTCPASVSKSRGRWVARTAHPPPRSTSKLRLCSTWTFGTPSRSPTRRPATGQVRLLRCHRGSSSGSASSARISTARVSRAKRPANGSEHRPPNHPNTQTISRAQAQDQVN